MKLTAILAATCLAFPANAGQLAFEGPAEAEVIVPEGAKPMGGSGAWLLPLIAIGLIAIAVSSSDDDPDEPDGCKQDCSPPPPEVCDKSCALIDAFGTDKPSEMTGEQREYRHDYYRETGGASGTGDWSGFADWLASQ